MQNKIHQFLMGMFLMAGIFSSCKKTHDATTTPVTPPAVVSADDKLKDSALLFTRDIYLWYNQIPSTFNPRTFADPDKIMHAIRQYSTEPGFTAPVDRFSFGIQQVEWNNLSNGITKDFGMSVFFLVEGDLRVKSVERESAAGKAGIRRGWRVTKINGSTNITTSNANFIVDNVFNSAHSTFTFLKPNGTSVDVTLDATTYNSHPVIADSVILSVQKRSGTWYLVLSWETQQRSIMNSTGYLIVLQQQA
ncbi:MAG: hypothetical protein H0W12_07090 [Chitinophagaceae bacterium]|nr:hypothetical protein [Chitinophagaceae bacterium]